MKSLPTLLTTEQLNNIVAHIESLPSAHVKRMDSILTITATKRKTGETVKVLSAATQGDDLWHVMAVEGLISTTFTN